MKATIVPNEIKVEHNIRPDVGREFLTFDVEGWDEVQKLSKKVLVFNDKKFTFSGWNSDNNQCFFAKPLDFEASFAKIV